MQLSPIPDGISRPLVRLYETVPFLDSLTDATVDAFTALGGSAFVAYITAAVVVGALICALGWAFVRLVTTALPTAAWAVVLGSGLVSVGWVLLTPERPDGAVRVAVQVLSVVGVLSVAGLLTAGVDLADAAGRVRASNNRSDYR